MKRYMIFAFAVFGIFFLSVVTINKVAAQSDQKEKVFSNPIPPGVMKILNKSCVNCHSEPGKILALSHVNLSKWDQYSAQKQADKAKLMCKKISKGKMPPKKFRANSPDAVPTSDEIKTICDWANSFQTK